MVDALCARRVMPGVRPYLIQSDKQLRVAAYQSPLLPSGSIELALGFASKLLFASKVFRLPQNRISRIHTVLSFTDTPLRTASVS